MVSFFHRVSVSVVKETIMGGFGLTATEFGLMASMYFYAYCIAQIPVGLLADSVGVRVTASAALLIASAGTFLFGVADSPLMLFVGRFIVGLGVAASFVCVMKIQSQWFKEREFSTLSGTCLFLGNVGSLSAQTPFALLVAWLSFRGAFYSISLATFLLAILCFWLVRNKPQDKGFAPVAPVPSAQEPAVGLKQSLLTAVTTKQLMILNVFYFFAVPQLLSFSGAWSIAYVRDIYGLSLTASSNLASCQLVGFMLGSIVIGYYSDRLGKRKPFLIYPGIVVALLWCFLAVAGGPALPPYAYAACLAGIGFCSGQFGVMMTTCKESGPSECTGTAIAVLNTFGFLGIALATPLYGRILDAFIDAAPAVQHHYATIFMAAITVVSVLLSLGIKETDGRNIFQAKTAR
jgi:sugar phosphate permease